MKTAGVKQLRDKFTEYLRDVRRGETVLVTDRGQVVAELNPPGGAHPAPVPNGIDARLVALAAEGRVRLPTASTEQLERVRRFRPLGLPDGTAQALLDAERGE